MRCPAVLAAALLPALAGCGGGGGGRGEGARATTEPGPRAAVVVAGLEPPAGCYVTVLLVADATRRQVARVERELVETRAIAQVSFVSKGLAFRRFAQTNPHAAKGMHANPFAARFEVVPRTASGAFAIVGRLAVEGGPIASARPSNGCG
ncbi:MAG TPA: permease-like cell division protein FtsX [Gaiellaceae bacterium]|nr:permease-like cell division protein FtsX [Gaiellaceae bacterium]